MRIVASKQIMVKVFLVLLGCCVLAGNTAMGSSINELSAARDRQDLSTLDRLIAESRAAAANAASVAAQYQLALANSYAAEVALELRDKRKSEAYAEAGMEPAQKAVAGDAGNAEYHRLMGQLCGQVIPANPLMGALKYGPCARDEITKALQLNNRLALAYVSRGVGNFYLPAAMGGGVDQALKDFDKAVALDPKLPDAYLWKGVTLHKANRDAEARKALEQAAQLDPARLWTKQQLGKIPAQ